MRKVNITITSKMLKSVVFGFTTTIALLLIIHFFSKVGYNASGYLSGCENNYLNWYQLKCPLNTLHRFEPDGLNVCDAIDMQFDFNQNRISAILRSFLGNHFIFLITVGLFLSIGYYFKNAISIKYKKE